MPVTGSNLNAQFAYYDFPNALPVLVGPQKRLLSLKSPINSLNRHCCKSLANFSLNTSSAPKLFNRIFFSHSTHWNRLGVVSQRCCNSRCRSRSNKLCAYNTMLCSVAPHTTECANIVSTKVFFRQQCEFWWGKTSKSNIRLSLHFISVHLTYETAKRPCKEHTPQTLT